MAGGLNAIADALSGKPTPVGGTGQGPGYNAAPFPKQLNPRMNAEAAAALAPQPGRAGLDAALSRHADKLHPVK